MTRRTIRGGLACAASIALLATGCHVEQPNTPTPPAATSQTADQLTSLPSFEETRVQLEAAINDIATAATQKVPDIVWQTATNADSGSCPAPYAQSDGQSAYLPNRVAENVTVSDGDWASLLQVATDAARKLAATDVQVMQDQPGKHDVSFTGPAGMFIKFSYKGNMVISGYTGCRLPQGKKPPPTG